MYREVVKLLVQCMIVFLVAITLSSCGQGEDVPSTGADDMPRKAAVDSSKVEKMLAGAGGQLVYRKDYIFTKKNYKLPYLDYDELCLKDGEEILTTGKYANITPDGKIDWAKQERQHFYEEKDAKEMKIEDLVSLNDKPFRLPCKFADLGEEYAVFDKIDFSLMTDANLFPFIITDTNTGTSLVSESIEYYGKSDGRLHFNLVNKDLEPILDVDFQLPGGEIVEISTGSADNLSLMNIKVGEIQIGNTLNEAYEKLGVPWYHNGVAQSTLYLYRDGGRAYYVHFFSNREIYVREHHRAPTKGTNVIVTTSVKVK